MAELNYPVGNAMQEHHADKSGLFCALVVPAFNLLAIGEKKGEKLTFGCVISAAGGERVLCRLKHSPLNKENTFRMVDHQGTPVQSERRAVNGEQNRAAANTQLALPVLALGGDAFIGARNEEMMRQLATNVVGHVFHAGHDLAAEVPAEMAAVILPFLATHQGASPNRP